MYRKTEKLKVEYPGTYFPLSKTAVRPKHVSRDSEIYIPNQMCNIDYYSSYLFFIPVYVNRLCFSNVEDSVVIIFMKISLQAINLCSYHNTPLMKKQMD